MKITMAPGENCIVIDPVKLQTRAEVERFIKQLRKVADAVWPSQPKQVAK